MSDRQEMPDFPNVAGARHVGDGDRRRISEAAWQQAHGNVRAYEQLCAEHVRGEIDLFSDDPTAIRIRGASPSGVGSDRFTATGGEVAGEAGAAPSHTAALSEARSAPAAAPAAPMPLSAPAAPAGVAPNPQPGAATVAAPEAQPGNVTSAGPNVAK